jgi:hypothetical protein
MTRLRSIFCGIVCLVVLTLSAAAAELRPHQASGGAQFISATQFIGAGHATHLGAYTEVGTVAFTPTNDPAVLRVDGANVYTAANGDQLYGSFTGELNGVTGAVTATITYAGGTGRFAGATGSSALTGQMLGGGALAVSVDGGLSY